MIFQIPGTNMNLDLSSRFVQIAVVVFVIILALYLFKGKSFGSQYGGGKRTIILYYVPWCGHCKNMMPEWQKLEQQHTDDPNVSVKKINCDEEPEKAQRDGVERFPTIILYKGQEKEIYQGKRDTESLEQFISQ
jgi:protein disulfide-isomerase-like protein